MAITVSILTGGSNGHSEGASSFNALATDFIAQGVVGAIANTAGVAPSTGAMALNAQSSPNTTTQVTPGTAYVQGTPASGSSQMFRVVDTTGATITHAANASGATRYDWVYLSLDATKLANPAADSSDVATYFVSRSTLSTSDTGTPPSYGYLIAVATITNSFTTVTNAQISDKRVQTGATVGTNSVDSTKLATSAITLGYASSAANFSTASTSAVQVTGLTATVTIPAGGRKVRITAYMPSSSVNTAGNSVLSLWDGVVGSGSLLNSSGLTSAGANYFGPITTFAIVTPAAGSKTYNVGFNVSAGTGNTLTSAGTMFILVEAI